jgi:hypothetical protein
MRTAIAELISAARSQAERLRRKSFTHADHFAQVLFQAEAEWWMELADKAEQEAAAEHHARDQLGRPP